MVVFGNASGPVDAFNLGVLSQKGSLYVTRPTLFTYTATREDLLACATDLFDVVGGGAVKIRSTSASRWRRPPTRTARWRAGTRPDRRC
jgi:hypothetical protein